MYNFLKNYILYVVITIYIILLYFIFIDIYQILNCKNVVQQNTKNSVQFLYQLMDIVHELILYCWLMEIMN